MPTISLSVDKPVVPSELVPVRAFAVVRNNGFPLSGAQVMLNVDGSNIVMGNTNAAGVIDYTQNYAEGLHTIFAWIGNDVSPSMILQVNKAPEKQHVCGIAISQTAQMSQCVVGDRVRYKVTVMSDDEGGLYTEMPHTVYMAFDNEIIDSKTTMQGIAYFDVRFINEGKFTLYAYDGSYQSDVMYMEVLPATAKSPEITFPNNYDNFGTPAVNPRPISQTPTNQSNDLIGQFLGWIKSITG